MQPTLYPDLIPSFEHERLEALQPYQVLGTPGQELFNDFVSVVAKLLDAPIALVSLVRATDMLFVGNIGLPDATGINREDSMCSVAILNDGLTVFENLATEPCALVNPFAAQQMQLAFYVGVPLRAPGGMAIGTLCVLDRRPRRLSAAERALLEQLAQVAQDLLQLQVAQAPVQLLSPALRVRFDRPLQRSLGRLTRLAELRECNPDDPTDSAPACYVGSRLEEANGLAQSLHQELQMALADLEQISLIGAN